MISTISLQCVDWNPKDFKSPLAKQTYCQSGVKQNYLGSLSLEVLSDFNI